MCGVCVCACVYAWVRACMCACVYVCGVCVLCIRVLPTKHLSQSSIPCDILLMVYVLVRTPPL